MSEFPPGEITPGSSSIEEGRHPISHEPEALRRDIGPQTPDRSGLLELERPLDPESFPDPPRSGSATVPTTIPNVAHLLTAYNIRVNYDLIKKRLVVRLPRHIGTPDNRQESTLRCVESLAALNRMAAGSLFGFVYAVGDANPTNPVLAWIDGTPWDRIDRLPDIYATLTCNSDFSEKLKEALVHRWLLSAVAAAAIPNFSSRGVLTFQGRQGLGKTRWFESLVPDALLRAEVIRTGHHLDPRSKDDVLGAVTHWIVELGELD